MYNMCQITSTYLKKSKIVKIIKDRPSRDALFANKYSLKEKSPKDLEFTNKNSIFINKSLSFAIKKFLFDIRNNIMIFSNHRRQWHYQSKNHQQQSIKPLKTIITINTF